MNRKYAINFLQSDINFDKGLFQFITLANKQLFNLFYRLERDNFVIK